MTILGLPMDMRDLIAVGKNNFHKYDKNEDQQLSLMEMESGLENFISFFRKTTPMNIHLNKEMIQTIFDLIDENNDRNLSLDEMKGFGNDITKGRMNLLLEKLALNKAFHFVDKDRDGNISKKEISATLKQFNIAKELNPAIKMMANNVAFNALDKNGDKKITKPEISQILAIKQNHFGNKEY